MERGTGPTDTIFPGRPSAPAAVSFLLLGIVLLTGKNNRFRFFILCSLVIVTLIASLTFLGYIFRIPYINTSPTLSKLALNTSVAFIAVAAGIYYSDQLRSLLLSFRQKLAAGFLLIILMLSLILYIYTQNDKGFVNSARWVEHTNEILYRSEKMLSTLTTIESGVRAYALTEDTELIVSLPERKKETFTDIEQVRKLTDDNPIQQKRMDTLLGLVGRAVQAP